jgi:hypothetical protein
MNKAATQTDPLVQQIRRSLNNMRSYIRRTGLTGWVKDRNVAYGYKNLYADMVRLEDRDGITDTLGALDDRLTALRREAMHAGLLTPEQVSDAERAAIDAVDAEKGRRS